MIDGRDLVEGGDKKEKHMSPVVIRLLNITFHR
jgi:hypothetical protein